MCILWVLLHKFIIYLVYTFLRFTFLHSAPQQYIKYSFTSQFSSLFVISFTWQIHYLFRANGQVCLDGGYVYKEQLSQIWTVRMQEQEESSDENVIPHTETTKNNEDRYNLRNQGQIKKLSRYQDKEYLFLLREMLTTYQEAIQSSRSSEWKNERTWLCHVWLWKKFISSFIYWWLSI